LFLTFDWQEWLKLITTTFVGGLLSYFYVMYREDKKEKRDIKRENEKDENKKRVTCTTALLNTQMMISFQMDELKGVEDICLSITNFAISGVTLREHLKSIGGISAKAAKLQELISKQTDIFIKDLVKLTYHMIITAPVNTVIVLPHEIFSLTPIKFNEVELTVAELANFFKGISTCNRRYMQIISLIKHQNDIRKIVISKPISSGEAGLSTPVSEVEELQKIFQIAAAMFDMAIEAIKHIESYFEKAEAIFTKSGDYIQLLEISPSIQVARDQDGKMLFEKITSP